MTSDTGYFWFFDAANVEVILKALDGCGVNGRYWVFASGLTDVNVELAVTDTRTGSRRIYRNPQGTAFQPRDRMGSWLPGRTASFCWTFLMSSSQAVST